MESTELRESMRVMKIAGGLLIALGILAIVFPFATGISLTVLLGALLVVGGLVHIANAFSVRGWKMVSVQVLLAIVYSLAGIALLANPVVGLTTLTVLLIIYFAAEGLVELYMGIRMRRDNGAWIAASGVVSLLLAGLLWTAFPADALWAVGLLFGINLLVTGFSLFFVSRGVTKELETARPMGETEARGA
ncbi:HdeD family acid-resistance protein (plasmid) [Haloferacaceae archaeon DSL9]